jgi:hypothetical protein
LQRGKNCEQSWRKIPKMQVLLAINLTQSKGDGVKNKVNIGPALDIIAVYHDQTLLARQEEAKLVVLLLSS